MKNLMAAVGTIVSFFVVLGALGVGDMVVTYFPHGKPVCGVAK